LNKNTLRLAVVTTSPTTHQPAGLNCYSLQRNEPVRARWACARWIALFLDNRLCVRMVNIIIGHK